MRRWGLAAVAWVVAAVATTFVGIAAVESLGDGILGSPEQPLSRGNVESQLAAAPQPTASTAAAPVLPSDTPSQPPVAAPSTTTGSPKSTRVLTSDGGTIVASCDGGLVTLVSWSPAQGYQVVQADRGPAKSVTVRFNDDSDEEDHIKRVTVFCRNGRPEATADEEDKSKRE
jgi:hypothetical protein